MWAFWKMGRALRKDSDDFGQICGHLPTFCPLLKPRFGQQKPSIYAGLRAQSPLSHFFSSTIMIESLKVYSNIEKKVGFWPRVKMEEIMSKISWESLYENFKSIYPRLSRSSVYFRPFGYMSIVVYFEDGMKMIYDDLRKQAYITA